MHTYIEYLGISSRLTEGTDDDVIHLHPKEQGPIRGPFIHPRRLYLPLLISANDRSELHQLTVCDVARERARSSRSRRTWLAVEPQQWVVGQRAKQHRDESVQSKH